MKITTAFLAEKMELAPSGCVNIEGAFPEFLTPPELQYSMEIPIGFIASLEPDEVDKTFLVEISTGTSRAGGILASGELMFGRLSDECADGAPIYVFQTVTQVVTFTEAAAHAMMISDDSGPLAIIPFGVRVLAA